MALPQISVSLTSLKDVKLTTSPRYFESLSPWILGHRITFNLMVGTVQNFIVSMYFCLCSPGEEGRQLVITSIKIISL
jgi:hypothetical protein